MGKKSFATTLDEDVLRQFKATCVLNDQKMNEVLEELMQEYVDKAKKWKPE